MKLKKWTIGCASAALFVFVLSVILNPPATAYEVSLYDAYHSITWLAFATAFVCFVVTLTVAPQYRGQAVVGIAALYSVFLTLPDQRGYVFFGTPLSDLIYHLGIVRDLLINSTPHLPLYPLTHVLLGEIALVTGLPLTQLQPIGSLTATALMIIGTVLAGQHLVDSRSGPYVLVAAVPLVFTIHHIALQPWFYALAFIPFVLSVSAIRHQSWGKRIVGLILAVGMVLFHPLTALFGLVAMTIIVIKKARGSPRLITRVAYILTPATLLGYWVLHFHRVRSSIELFLTPESAQYGSSGTFSYASQATSMAVPLWRLIWEYLILQWGTAVIYSGIAGLVTLLVMWYFVKGKKTSGNIAATIYVVGVLFGGVFAAADLFARNPIRIAQFGLIIAPILIGYALWLAYGNWDFRCGSSGWLTAVKTGTVAFLLIAVIGTAMLAGGTLYDDHRHITESTMDGTTWYLDYHDREHQTHAQRMAVNMEIYYHGYSEARSRERVFSRYDPKYHLPPRLGYDENPTVGTWTDGYLITKTEDIVRARGVPSNGSSEAAFYTEDDQNLLERDQTVSSVYDNGNFWIWKAS